MKDNILRCGGIAILAMLLVSGSLVLISEPVRADSWSDHFDGPNGEVFHPRWTKIGTDIGIQDGTTYFKALDYDTGVNVSWHGPTIRAPLSPSGDFNISAIFYCLTSLDLTLGRADVRLLDSSGLQVFAFGWEDGTRVDINARVWLRGSSDAQVLFNTGQSLSYASFLTRGVSLSRANGITKFFIDNQEKYSGDAGRTNIAFVELSLQKFGGEAECPTDIMYFDRISVETTPSTPPGIPTGLLCEPGASSANLNWTAPADDGGAPVSGYKIYRGTAPGAATYLTTIGPLTSYLDSALTNGVTYYYRVGALNVVGESQLSAESSVTPVSVPGPPTGLQATGGDAQANISWDHPLTDGGSDISAYRVYRTVGNDTIMASEAAGLSFSDTAVSNGVSYSYAVTAVNSVGEGAACAPVSVIPGSSLSVPSSPRDLTLTGHDGSTTLTWNPPDSNGNSQILNYTIYRGEALDSISMLAMIPAVNTFNDAGLVNGVTYYYKLSATNSIGEGPLSDVAACTPESLQPPSQPREFNAMLNELATNLTWFEPANDGGSAVTGYRIYRGLSPGNATLLADMGVAFSYVDSGLAWNTTYYYSISALNSEGEGIPSEQVSVTTAPPPLDQNSTEEPLLSWTDYFNVTSTFATVVALAIGLALTYLFMRSGGGRPETASKSPDEAVDDKPENDGSNEERAEDPDRDFLPEGGG